MLYVKIYTKIICLPCTFLVQKSWQLSISIYALKVKFKKINLISFKRRLEWKKGFCRYSSYDLERLNARDKFSVINGGTKSLVTFFHIMRLKEGHILDLGPSFPHGRTNIELFQMFHGLCPLKLSIQGKNVLFHYEVWTKIETDWNTANVYVEEKVKYIYIYIFT